MIDTTAPTHDLTRMPRRKAVLPDITKVDRLPPHSPEAEKGVLGCVMLSPNECMGDCLTKLKVGSEVFYDLRHQTIFNAMAEMFDKREPIDVITLHQRLKDQKVLDEVGGIAYLSALPDAVPSSANLDYYLNILNETREQTLAEFRKRDDNWLMTVDKDWGWGPTNNYCKWFHVCEHESNHNGQIKFLKSRLPGAKPASE